MELLNATVEHNGNPQVLHPLVREKLDTLNLTSGQPFAQWSMAVLSNIPPHRMSHLSRSIEQLSDLIWQMPADQKHVHLEIALAGYQTLLQMLYPDSTQPADDAWATIIRKVGIMYRIRLEGDPSTNLEQARTCFEQALIVWTKTSHPDEWAMTMYNLGVTYYFRRHGERAANLEAAITCFTQALTVPLEDRNVWASIMHNLGTTYRDSMHGERTAHLEAAIESYRHALTMRTKAAFPNEWASTMNALGKTYYFRRHGERAANLEEARTCFEQALTVRTAPSEGWAATMHDLGIIYHERLREERAENLEEAITCFNQALTVRTKAAFPDEWASTMNVLGNAYQARLRGERAENLEEARTCFEQALTVRTEPSQDWAISMHNLGIVYQTRLWGERAENLEEARTCFEQALTVWNKASHADEWASTINSLGVTYLLRIHGERAENLEEARTYFEQALTVHTQSTAPYDWARIINNLGFVYCVRHSGHRTEDLNQAIRYYQQVLTVKHPDTFPQDCRDTAYALGLTYYELAQYTDARRALATAHTAIQYLWGDAPRQEAKGRFSHENADLYAHLVACCLRKGDIHAAFAYTLAGKGRALVDTLATTHIDLLSAAKDNPQLAHDLQHIAQIRQQIDTIQSQFEQQALTATTETRVVPQQQSLWETLRQLQHQERARWEDLSYAYPALTATQQVPALTVADMQLLAQELQATLVEYYHHHEGWCAFVVTAQHLQYIPLPHITDELIATMMNWLHLMDSDFRTSPLLVGKPLQDEYQALIEPLQHYFSPDDRVMLSPHWALHLFPISAAQHPETRRYLCEDYLLTYTPSLAALWVMHQQAVTAADTTEQPHQLRLCSMAYAPDIVDIVPTTQQTVHLFAPHLEDMYDQQATPDALIACVRQTPSPDILHLVAHGWFDSELPEQSGLALSGGWLTVQRIIRELPLAQTHLVTLAACLLGQATVERSGETMGITQAFLTAGAQSVVTALWSVEPEATMALFQSLYRHIVAGWPPAVALQEALTEVRTTPGWEHPFYWAAWHIHGCAMP